MPVLVNAKICILFAGRPRVHGVNEVTANWAVSIIQSPDVEYVNIAIIIPALQYHRCGKI